MKKLYKFHWDCGRMGDVEGLFFADEQVVEKSIGEHIHFGEILGKHSEIQGTLEKGDITSLDVSPEACEELLKAVGRNTISGYNPLEYIPVGIT